MLTPGLRIVLLLPLIPTLALVIVFMAVDDDAGPVRTAVTILILSTLLVVEQLMHAWITVRSDSVRMGFWPIFRRTIHFRDIAAVDAIEVDPMRDYGGWGLKGTSRSERGMLFSAGGHYGVMVTTRDGRRYVATAREPMDDVAETLRALVG